MADISATIALRDNFSNVLTNIINTVDSATSSMDNMAQTMGQNINTAGIDGITDSAQNAVMAIDEISDAGAGMGGYADSANTSYQRLDSTLQKNTVNARALVTAMMGMKAVQKLLSTITGQLDAAFSRMDTMTNYNRVMTAITGDADAAARSLDSLKEATTGTAYGLDVAAAAVQNFTTRGMNIDAATKEIGNWMDAVAFYGDGTNETLESVTDALGKMLSRGKVTMNNLYTLTNAGIDAVGMYATLTGRATADVQSDLTAGVITAEEFITTVSDAFESGTNGVLNISNAAKDAGATWATTFANMKAAVTRGLVDVIESINDSMNDLGMGDMMTQVANFGSTLEGVLARVGEAVGNVVEKIGPPLVTMFGTLEPIIASFGGAFIDMVQRIASNFGGFLDRIQPVWQSFVDALGAVWPVLQNIMDLIFDIGNVCGQVFGTILGLLQPVFNLVQNVANFINNNWATIRPILEGIAIGVGAIVSALILYNAWLGICQIAQGIMTAAQWLMNAAMYACPITWIVVGIAALIAVIVIVANKIAEMGTAATTAFGVITGGVNVVIQFFKNLGLQVANIALGIGNAISALGQNILAAFSNAISGVQSWWYGLLSTCLSVIDSICAALNKLPFVSFDYGGITSAANDYAAKSAAAAGNKKEYTSIADAYNSGASTYSAFDSGWAADAYASGAEWGDGVTSKVKGALSMDSATQKTIDSAVNAASSATTSSLSVDDSDLATAVSNTAKNTGSTASSAADVASAIDATSEELKYLRDIAERDVVNRFTTAEITVNQTNNNDVSSTMDLDGLVEGLTDAVDEAVEIIAGGVHY